MPSTIFNFPESFGTSFLNNAINVYRGTRETWHGIEVESETAEFSQRQGESPTARVHFQMRVLTQLVNINKLTTRA